MCHVNTAQVSIVHHCVLPSCTDNAYLDPVDLVSIVFDLGDNCQVRYGGIRRSNAMASALAIARRRPV